MGTAFRMSVAAIIAMTASLLATSAADAQLVLSGRLVQHQINTPVSGATVRLLSSSGRELDRITTTNKHGAFNMWVEPGRYRLRIRRIGGYDSLDTPLIVVEPRTNTQLVVSVTPVEARLLKQTTLARSSLETGREGMAKREPLGKGVFLYSKDIAEIASLPAWEIIGRAKGLRAVMDGSIRTLEGWGCLQFMVNRMPVTEIAESKLRGDEHEASFYQMLPNGVDIAGVEIYPKFADVPEEFRHDAWPYPGDRGFTPFPNIGNLERKGAMPPCGLINVWTSGAW